MGMLLIEKDTCTVVGDVFFILKHCPESDADVFVG